MENKPMVYKSNALVEAAYRLSVQEQRIILACIGQVRRDEEVTDEVLYSITAADLAAVAGIAVGDAYKELKDAALRLKRREVRLTQEPNGKGKKPKTMITGWVQTIFYIEGEGRVELRFTKDMLPYLTGLQREFTRYALSDVAKMTSAHGIRLYELLAQWPDGHRVIEVDELRRWLQLEDRYPLMADFRRNVIQPAVDQINEHSPLSLTWSQRKTGRKVTHLVFDYTPKKPAKALSKAPAKAAAKRKAGKYTDADIARLARPGESWEAARARLKGFQAGTPDFSGKLAKPVLVRVVAKQLFYGTGTPLAEIPGLHSQNMRDKPCRIVSAAGNFACDLFRQNFRGFRLTTP